ncbi:MAG: fatty acyl-AMP ligase [Alphaproteobacteria bacterium]|nr:fatty acyl-AMP ligase [Alphaproteobacteria bacterium]
MFATRDGEIAESLSFAALAARAISLAARLQALGARGERAALIFSPGLDFMVAMLGCMLSGVIAVPMALPRRDASRDQADAIIANCAPRFVLTTKKDATALLAPRLASRPQWQACRSIEIDDGQDEGPVADFAPSPGDIAFLQYTSGSTSSPKGVIVSQTNLLANLSMMRKSFGTSSDSRFACWVPLFHDMGLPLNALHALSAGAACILMAPLSFMQRPLAWLKVIADQRVDIAGCPNFGYDHCADYVQTRPPESLDLSSWRVAFNGAEPIRSATLDRFAAAFAPYGFDRRALFPCYGMAEATVIISGKTDRSGPAVQCRRGDSTLVSSGSAFDGEEVAIVEPATCTRLAAGAEGEIWARGPHIASGYWANAEATAAIFDARIAGEDGGWLRTGDLGFLDAAGELFVTGRLKDLIIVRGQNYYPQDIELSVQECHRAFHHQLGAAFTAPVGRTEQAVVVVQEVARRLRHLASDNHLETAAREAVANDHGLAVHKVVVVPPGTVPRRTSGKVQRSKARVLWLAGALTPAGEETGRRIETAPMSR